MSNDTPNEQPDDNDESIADQIHEAVDGDNEAAQDLLDDVANEANDRDDG